MVEEARAAARARARAAARAAARATAAEVMENRAGRGACQQAQYEVHYLVQTGGSVEDLLNQRLGPPDVVAFSEPLSVTMQASLYRRLIERASGGARPAEVTV